MAEPTSLEGLVSAVSWEIRRRRAEYYAFRGAFFGALGGLIPLLLKAALGSTAWPLALGLTLLGAAAGAASGLFLRLRPSEAGRLLDRAYGLQDRVATALEWSARPDRPTLVEALIADVRARLEGRDGRGVVARRWPREAKLLPVPIVAGLALILAPPLHLPFGALPDLLRPEGETETASEQPGKLLSDERPKGAKREPLERAGLWERDLTARQGTPSPNMPGDLSAAFKDTSVGYRSDFASFLKKGDERIRMLEQVDRLPDLQSDFTQSPSKMVFQKMKALAGGLRPDQFSPEKLRELLQEMERMGRKGGNWGGEAWEGMEALEQGQTDRALEAMEKALSKMRAMEQRERGGKNLRGGPEGDRRGGRGRDGSGPAEFDQDMSEGAGSLPGKGKSQNPKGDPSQRLRANPYDAGVEGEARQGRKEGFNTNLLGRGANLPSRLQYFGVFPQYRKMMEEALAREQVPRDYQTHVKEYFQALEER
jgi:hypothetical protein